MLKKRTNFGWPARAPWMWVLLALLLAGCGGGGSGSGSGSAVDTPTITAHLSAANVEHTTTTASAADNEIVTATLSENKLSSVWFSHTNTGAAIDDVVVNWATDSSLNIRIDFKPGKSMQEGSYTDTVSVYLCEDQACAKPLAGSPLVVSTLYVVKTSLGDEAGLPLLAPNSRTALSHDVVDAEYSRALDAVVMVSTWPQSALYVRNAMTGEEKSVTLSRLPTAVSLSPDGLHAAVGHDGLVSYVDLSAVGLAGAPAPKQFGVAARAGDLVLDGRGRVHVFPALDHSGWTNLHTIDIATNTDTLGPQLFSDAQARLLPPGDRIYAADNGLSPSDIEAYDISGATVIALGDSPYHGQYSMCGGLWFSADGASIYTACGAIFRASTDPAQDMLYGGSLVLGTDPTAVDVYRVVSASQTVAGGEIALIEQSWRQCSPIGDTTDACRSHLNLYAGDSLNRTAQYSIPLMKVAGTTYLQRGLFVFHRTGGGKLLISQLAGIQDHAAEFYVSELP